MSHWVTNRGKLLIAQGDWDDIAGGDIFVGLLKGASIPASIDTEAEVQVFNFVSDLTGAAGVTEADFTNYARTALTRAAATEDDANDRVNFDASDVTISAAGGASNNELIGGFIFKAGGSDAARALISLFLFATTITTNGSDLTLTIADLYRLS